MENNQSIKHELNQVKRPKAVLKSSKSVAISSYKIFIYLLTRHPLLLLVGVFTTLMGTAGMALHSIAHVGDVEPFESEPVPAVVEQPITTITSENSNPLPLWMIVAIALSCASGSLVIFRLLNPPPQRPQVQKRQAIFYQAPSTPTRARKQPPVIQTQPISAPSQTSRPTRRKQTTQKPIITVMQSEQRNPFEDGKESLVDLLDWRKHNSLTSILQQYSS
ncbi:hypothetical protein H6G83_23470 [Anabaena azotica FACHB-119]|uniref:Uncharacterized protein n=1 Tax=Anabaena azotica FACHB-119 TaxID=947527 RepID=A0ABR8D8K8_9NOST|nr:hypothetical protein [Anabaena azotica FACHB-119]